MGHSIFGELGQSDFQKRKDSDPEGAFADLGSEPESMQPLLLSGESL